MFDMYNDYSAQKLADARIAEFHAEADRERLARQAAPERIDSDNRIVLLIVVLVALAVVFLVV